jgi:hypothetical protein
MTIRLPFPEFMMQLPGPTRELPVRDFEIFPQPANVVERVFKEPACETIISLGHLAEQFDVRSAGYEIRNVRERAASACAVASLVPRPVTVSPIISGPRSENWRGLQ